MEWTADDQRFAVALAWHLSGGNEVVPARLLLEGIRMAMRIERMREKPLPPQPEPAPVRERCTEVHPIFGECRGYRYHPGPHDNGSRDEDFKRWSADDAAQLREEFAKVSPVVGTGPIPDLETAERQEVEIGEASFGDD